MRSQDGNFDKVSIDSYLIDISHPVVSDVKAAGSEDREKSQKKKHKHRKDGKKSKKHRKHKRDRKNDDDDEGQ